MLGDTLLGLTAFKVVVKHIRTDFPDIETQALLAWNARPGVENIVRRCPDVQRIRRQAITLREFCQFDAYWDFSALLALPCYDTIHLVDFYLQNFGIDPATVPVEEKVPSLVLDNELCAAAQQLLCGRSGNLPLLLIQAQASNLLRSMPDTALLRLLESVCESGNWQAVVLNPMPETIKLKFSERVLDLSEWSAQSIDHCFALMSCTNAIVTVDTLAVHAATALGTSGVALFTTIDPALRIAYSLSLKGMLIPGARELPAWGRHKTDDDWPQIEGAYEAAWLEIDWPEILAGLESFSGAV
jgi:ADP-heptose:LPS heptosyltransferase